MRRSVFFPLVARDKRRCAREFSRAPAFARNPLFLPAFAKNLFFVQNGVTA